MRHVATLRFDILSFLTSLKRNGYEDTITAANKGIIGLSRPPKNNSNTYKASGEVLQSVCRAMANVILVPDDDDLIPEVLSMGDEAGVGNQELLRSLLHESFHLSIVLSVTLVVLCAANVLLWKYAQPVLVKYTTVTASAREKED